MDSNNIYSAPVLGTAFVKDPQYDWFWYSDD